MNLKMEKNMNIFFTYRLIAYEISYNFINV
jgi:hypothetical protein